MNLDGTNSPLSRPTNSRNRSHVTEDELTECLASELRSTEGFPHLFLAFLFGGQVPEELAKTSVASINTQYRLSENARRAAQVGSRGRLDLLLILRQSGRQYAVAVEHKVWDEEKPSRLHNYSLLLEEEGFHRSWLFEIVRERDYDLTEAEGVSAVHRWADLLRFLEQHPSSSCIAQGLAQRLNGPMKQAGALVPGVITRKANSAMALSDIETDALRALAAALSTAGFHAKVTRDKGVPMHIRARRPDWPHDQPGRWHDRLWIYLERTPSGARGFRMQMLFHNANFTDLDYAARLLPSWARAFTRIGYGIYRGPARGWDGAKRVLLAEPWRLDCSPKYFYAEEHGMIATTPPLSTDQLNADMVQRAIKCAQTFEASFRT